jgi:nucleoid-associated protein YgaU
MVDKNGNPPTTHPVKDDERLFDIAQAYYGDGNQWQKIADANGIKKPEDLKSGQVLQIP